MPYWQLWDRLVTVCFPVSQVEIAQTGGAYEDPGIGAVIIAERLRLEKMWELQDNYEKNSRALLRLKGIQLQFFFLIAALLAQPQSFLF